MFLCIRPSSTGPQRIHSPLSAGLSYGQSTGQSTDSSRDSPQGNKKRAGRNPRSFCCLCPSVLPPDYVQTCRRCAFAPAVTLLPFQHTQSCPICFRSVGRIQHGRCGILGGYIPRSLGRRPWSGIIAECGFHFHRVVLPSQNRRKAL